MQAHEPVSRAKILTAGLHSNFNFEYIFLFLSERHHLGQQSLNDD